ncbi:MAG: hypothetical protein CMM49_05365 [Rhodospirillaceae bacterium]|nr:hypothetical protein [Rhodospirillaceae bacterium]
MGFYDSKGYSVLAIKSVIYLMKIINIKINCDIFIGSTCPHLNDIKETIKGNKSFRLFLNKNNLKDLYIKFDLALGALGMSFLERIQIGVPSIVIPQNKIQKKLIRYWQRQNVAFVSENNIRSILNSMVNLILCDSIRVTKVENGKALLDGNGSKRIAKIIKDFDEDKISIL